VIGLVPQVKRFAVVALYDSGMSEYDSSLVYVGRIKRYKAVDHAIRALAILRRAHPDVTLTIVGDGDGIDALKRLTSELGLDAAVRFAGFLPHADKVRLLQSAHVVVNPSVKEGWGLTNVEANACGTVCVAADSPGLRDSVKDGVRACSIRGATCRRSRIRWTGLADPASAAMEAGALAWADSLTWARCGERRSRSSSRSWDADGEWSRIRSGSSPGEDAGPILGRPILRTISVGDADTLRCDDVIGFA
jgi:glycosyltransferase involved in cell wall biosynthesis